MSKPVRIVVQDLVAELQGGSGQELEKGTVIRYELPTGNITVEVRGDEIVIRKVVKSIGDEQLKIMPDSTNRIKVF